jgi:hypothetical protein
MAQQIVPALLGFMLLGIVFELVRRRRLRERSAVFWTLLGIALILVGLLPEATEWVSSKLGFELPSNLIFFVSIIVLFALALQAGVEIARLERHVRILAEEVAILRLATRDPDDEDTRDDSL